MPIKIEVLPHDSQWKNEFDREFEHLKLALGEVVVAIHHIGSTAIPSDLPI